MTRKLTRHRWRFNGLGRLRDALGCLEGLLDTCAVKRETLTIASAKPDEACLAFAGLPVFCRP
eukprot:5359305-Alexandrium_andersonii.AAC.1